MFSLYSGFFASMGDKLCLGISCKLYNRCISDFVFVPVILGICIATMVSVFCMGNVCNSVSDIYIYVFGTNTLCRYLYSLRA